jgi:hypothetical protein
VQLGNEDSGIEAGETPNCPTGKMAVLRLILSHRLGERNVAGFQIELGFGGSAEDFGAVIVELALDTSEN